MDTLLDTLLDTRMDTLVRQNQRHARMRPLACTLLAAAALALSAPVASAQNPLTPKLSLQGDQKRPLTPEEVERQKRIDAEYKAATSKIPDQKTVDPWATVRPAPADTPPKKKQQ
jgi:hypothetical protein